MLLRRRTSPAATAAALLMALTALACVGYVLSFATDAAFNNLKFYGPTPSDSNWAPYAMTLIADYTWQIADWPLTEGQQFLFVNQLSDGTDDFKNGKLGSGSTPSALLIGGGNIVIAQRGTWNLTVQTTSAPQPLTLTRTPVDVYPTAAWAPASGGFVQSVSDVTLTATFSTSVNTSLLSAASFAVSPASGPTNGWTWNVVSSTAVSVRFPSLSLNAAVAGVTLVSVTLLGGATAATTGGGHPNTASTFAFVYEPYGGAQPSWQALYNLRDNSNLFTDNKPAGGWFVTPIHLQLLSANGSILVTGWSRREDVGCTGYGSRLHGVTFVVSPDELSGAAGSAQPFMVSPVNEDPRFVGNPSASPVQSADVMYCSGHTALGDGRKLFIAGAHYLDVSTANEKEFGLNYGRIYDPIAHAITRIPFNFSLTAWYPTATLLPNGNVLIARGFTDYATYSCSGMSCASPGLFVLDRSKLDAAAENPWTTLVADTAMTTDIDPAVTDYTRTYVLPQPVPLAGGWYDVLMVGAAGRIVLLNTTSGAFASPPNANRPAYPTGAPYFCNNQYQPSGMNSALLAPTGEVLLVGPCAFIDLYNPLTDSWRRVDSGIVRNKPASLLLPTGDVLLLNGENPNLDQSAAGPQAVDPRFPQIVRLNATSATITTLSAREPESSAYFRGYHNTVALLKDGRILSGGGTSNLGGIGCEHTNLRLFSPPYLEDPALATARPVIDPQLLVAEPWQWYQQNPSTGVRTAVTFDFQWPTANGGQLRSVRGAALVATSAFTHGSCQHQRYIELAFTTTLGGGGADGASTTINTITVTLPPSPMLFPGEYLLFLVSAEGIPSVAKAVYLMAMPPAELGGAPANSATLLWTLTVLFVSCVVVGALS